LSYWGGNPDYSISTAKIQIKKGEALVPLP